MNLLEPAFKGYVKPGPVPPGAKGNGPEIEEGETLDAISGYYRLFQLRNGHRFSTDDVLVALGTCWIWVAASELYRPLLRGVCSRPALLPLKRRVKVFDLLANPLNGTASKIG